MDTAFFIAVNLGALRKNPAFEKRLDQGLCWIGRNGNGLEDNCAALVKFRAADESIRIDPDARIAIAKNEYFIRSTTLAERLKVLGTNGFLIVYVEGTPTDARLIALHSDGKLFNKLVEADYTIRLPAFDLPPTTATVVDAEKVFRPLYRFLASQDRDLFAVHASQFLDAPTILTALLSHVFTIRAEDNVRFPVQVKKLADQLRELLRDARSTIKIKSVEKSHVDLWASVQGNRFSFLDGGVARIPALAGIQPMALRVGVYSVRPGISDLEEREQWRMAPFVLGDLLDGDRRLPDRPDPRRFQEAARYVLEPLSGLQHLKVFADVRLLMVHGPLITQFLQYDEYEPSYIPFVSPEFLERFGILERDVTSRIADIPTDEHDRPMWNQFMAIYAYVMHLVADSNTPIIGVVERPVGKVITTAVLDQLVKDRVIDAAYVKRVVAELERYDITDDFLFGCVIRPQEYTTPVVINKNNPRRARDWWKPVVQQYPRFAASLLKTDDMNFPFRMELNPAAERDFDFVARFIYHTARLLPRYAFPVGLDIVDKYAKIPDWIARGISAELSTSILRRALKSGDPRLVAQLRTFLARGPRDFFFRPSARY